MKNKIQELVLIYMDRDMIEFYLTYKQNQNCKLQHNKKSKIPQNTPQSVNENKS